MVPMINTNWTFITCNSNCDVLCTQLIFTNDLWTLNMRKFNRKINKNSLDYLLKQKLAVPVSNSSANWTSFLSSYISPYVSCGDDVKILIYCTQKCFYAVVLAFSHPKVSISIYVHPSLNLRILKLTCAVDRNHKQQQQKPAKSRFNWKLTNIPSNN